MRFLAPTIFLAFLVSCGEAVSVPTERELLNQYCNSTTNNDYYTALGEIIPDSLLEGKAIIACGQSTHGSKEDFQIQAELFKRLVKNQGCRTFIMEANYSSLLLVNEYVNGGIFAKDEVMRSLDFWVWDTEEVWGLIEWVREFNKSVSDGSPILFLGNDIQKVRLCAKGALEFFQQFGVSYSDSVSKILIPLVNDTSPTFTMKNAEGDGLFLAEMSKLDMWAEQVEIPIGQTQETFKLSKYNLTILRQALELVNAKPNVGSAYRDSAMAMNVKGIIQLDLRTGPVYIWAHNYHIANMKKYGQRMGAYLTKWYGIQYLCVAIDFSCEGRFNARQPIQDSVGPKIEYSDFSKPMECSIALDTNGLGYKIGQQEIGLTFLNVELCAADPSLKQTVIFQQARMHSIGAVFDSTMIAKEPVAYLGTVDLSREYDGIIFYGKSTPTILLNTPRKPAVTASKQ